PLRFNDSGHLFHCKVFTAKALTEEATPERRNAMKKWEYIYLHQNSREDLLVKDLLPMGKERWKAISFTETALPRPGHVIYGVWMEREIPDPPRQPDYTGMTPEQIRRAQQEDAEEVVQIVSLLT
ncbi:MAG: hypothetical protein NTW46_01820, partial [Candidatus Nealsonbacteria bacterium]|nr:hypothetical protein [Candidatus Nealsonbacteria bacterium]